MRPEGTATPEGSKWQSARDLIGDGCFSVIMPAHHLAPVIAENVHHVYSLLREELPFEIVVVDDGSTDNTSKELTALAEDLPDVTPVILPENVGKGAALFAGFRACRGTHVMLLDADLDLPPEQICIFFDTMKERQVDIVIGSKRHPDSTLDYPWHRTILSNIYYLMVKTLFGLPVRDTQTGMKLLKREVLEFAAPRMLVKRFAFDLELLTVANLRKYRIAECPVVLEFKAGLGCVSNKAVRQILNDTLAIFYRLRVLKYYQRFDERNAETAS